MKFLAYGHNRPQTGLRRPLTRPGQIAAMNQQQRTIAALRGIDVPGVTRIAVSPDGLDVVFLGPDTTVEISLACQEALESVRGTIGPDVTGGFIARAPDVFPGYQPVPANADPCPTG